MAVQTCILCAVQHSHAVAGLSNFHNNNFIISGHHFLSFDAISHPEGEEPPPLYHLLNVHPMHPGQGHQHMNPTFWSYDNSHRNNCRLWIRFKTENTRLPLQIRGRALCTMSSIRSKPYSYSFLLVSNSCEACGSVQCYSVF